MIALLKQAYVLKLPDHRYAVLIKAKTDQDTIPLECECSKLYNSNLFKDLTFAIKVYRPKDKRYFRCSDASDQTQRIELMQHNTNCQPVIDWADWRGGRRGDWTMRERDEESLQTSGCDTVNVYNALVKMTRDSIWNAATTPNPRTIVFPDETTRSEVEETNPIFSAINMRYPLIQPKHNAFIITRTDTNQRLVGDDPAIARQVRRIMQSRREYQQMSRRRKVQTMRKALSLPLPLPPESDNNKTQKP